MDNQNDTLNTASPSSRVHRRDRRGGGKARRPASDGTARSAETSDFDPDARTGNKTSKQGIDEWFYGYEEHTLLQVPEGDDADAEPRLVRRLEITPASTDVVDPTLSLIDRGARRHTSADREDVTRVIVDRHYSYKDPDRWHDGLAERGVDQVLDLRSDEHGFTDIDHVRWAAGWAHCPATPDALGTIRRPGPGDANAEAREQFHQLINQRRAYAFRRVTSPDATGTARWECPARAGQIGCPNCPGTVDAATELGLPIVERPPDPTAADAPRCCTQRTVTIRPGKLRKHIQHHYWGSPEWEREWNKRTYVEGSYGNRKNPSTESFTRGHFRITGLALVNLVSAIAASAYNLRMLTNWHERTGLGDPNHPLLRADELVDGFVHLTREQYDALLEQLLHQGRPPDAECSGRAA